MPQVAQVAVDKATSSFDKLFTYRVPREMEGTLRPGCRVMVPFGAGDVYKRQLHNSFNLVTTVGNNHKKIAAPVQ